MLTSRFNGLVGFSEEDLKTMLNYYDAQGMLSDGVEDIIKVMKPWYDNYCFSKRSLNEPMYNSDMVLYFLNNYLPHQEAPDQMIDNNIRTDYNKLRHLIRIDKTFGVNASIIQDVVANGSIRAEINSSFSCRGNCATGRISRVCSTISVYSPFRKYPWGALSWESLT